MWVQSHEIGELLSRCRLARLIQNTWSSKFRQYSLTIQGKSIEPLLHTHPYINLTPQPKPCPLLDYKFSGGILGYRVCDQISLSQRHKTGQTLQLGPAGQTLSPARSHRRPISPQLGKTAGQTFSPARSHSRPISPQLGHTAGQTLSSARSHNRPNSFQLGHTVG